MRTVHRPLATLAALLLGVGFLAVAPAAQAEQVERQITIKGIEPRENTFMIKGKIAPSTGEKVNALVEVKHCKKDKNCGATWQKFEAITTNAKGRYSQRVKGPKRGFKRVYYRVSTRENKNFFAAVSEEIYIYRIL